MLAALSFAAERKPPLPKLQMWNGVLSLRQYSRLLPNFRFRFRFRLCASFRGGSVFRDPPCTRTCTRTGTGTGTPRNHFASPCDIFDGSHTFDGGTKQKQIWVQIAIKLLQVLSVQSKARASGTTLSPWTSRGFICSMSISEHDLMYTAPGEIVVNRQQHKVQSPKSMLTVVWDPIGFHVLEAPRRGANSVHNIIETISWSQSQIGGGRPGEHDRTNCGCILIMLGHTPPKCQGIPSVSIERNRHLISPIRQIWHPRTFLFPFSFLATSKES
jgi:hypothetical protein